MRVNIYTMFKTVFSGKVDEIVAPAVDGEISFYKNHAPVICPLMRGCLAVKDEKKTYEFYIVNGLIHVYSNNVDVMVQLR